MTKQSVGADLSVDEVFAGVYIILYRTRNTELGARNVLRRQCVQASENLLLVELHSFPFLCIVRCEQFKGFKYIYHNIN